MEAKLQTFVTLCVILLVNGAVLNTNSNHDQLQDNGLTNTKVQAFGGKQTNIAPRLDKTPVFDMFHRQPIIDTKTHLDQLDTDQRTQLNEYYWNSIFNNLFRELMSELRQNAKPVNILTNVNEEQAPVIKHRYKVSIIDPRTINRKRPTNNFIQPTQVLHNPPSPIVNSRTIESVTNLNEEPTPVINHQYKVSIVDPRTGDQASSTKSPDQPVSTIDHSQSAVIDPKTIESFPNLNDLPAPIIKHRYKVSIVDPRTIKHKETTRNLDKPGSKIDQLPSSVVDPKSIEGFPNLNDLPAPIIEHRYKVSIVDPRTIEQKGSTKNIDKPGPIIDQLPSSVGDPKTIEGLSSLNEEQAPMIEHRYKATIIDPRTIERTSSKQSKVNEALIMQNNPTTAVNHEVISSLWSTNQENVPIPVINNQNNPFSIYPMIFKHSVFNGGPFNRMPLYSRRSDFTGSMNELTPIRIF
ncbi:uncharacterized protein LOC127701306 [Mytilus californianus]|uniref:uncharacterized protein LOC127701306 n=1 Tax=Mytilus californianus TaxID=6549 RepID=UPI0022463814|nr:uncharacterized protein LOC127701306 [Mytilus californianus]